MTILPVISTIERLCANSLVAAEHRIEGHIAGRLNDTSCKRLDSLLVELIDGHLSRFVWLRKIEPGKNSADIIPTAFNIDRYGPIFAFRLM